MTPIFAAHNLKFRHSLQQPFVRSVNSSSSFNILFLCISFSNNSASASLGPSGNCHSPIFGSHKFIFVLVYGCLIQKVCFSTHTSGFWVTPVQLFCFQADFSLGLFYIHSFLRTPPPASPPAHVYAPLLLLLLL